MGLGVILLGANSLYFRWYYLEGLGSFSEGFVLGSGIFWSTLPLWTVLLLEGGGLHILGLEKLSG